MQRRIGVVPASSRRDRATADRVVRRLVLVLLASWALYLLAANAFLSFGGVERVFASTDQVTVKYRSAWTIVPGRVHVRGFRLVFSDYNVQFSLDIARVDLSVRLHELLSKTFRANRVEGSGLSFRFRHRVDPGAAWREATRALPPIPELLTPAVFEPLAPAVRTERYWTVHLEDVDVGVSEVWVQQFRYLGSGRARGAFRLVAGERVWVGRSADPARLELAPGRLDAGPFTVAEGLRGTIECVVHPFQVLVPVGMQPFRFIDTKAELEAPRARLDVLSLFGHEAGLAAMSEPGELAIDVEIERGAFRPESRAFLRVPRALANHPAWSASVEELKLSLAPRPGGGGEARVSVRSAGLDRPGRPGLPVVSGPISGAAISSSAHLDSVWSLSAVELEAPELLAPDLRWFEDIASKHELGSTSGSLAVSLAGRWEPGVLSGSFSARARGARIARGQLGVELDGRIEARAGEARFDRRAGRVDVELAAGRLVLTQARRELVLSELSTHARLFVERSRGRGALGVRIGSVSAKDGPLGLSARAELDASLVISDSVSADAEVFTRARVERIALHAPGARARVGALRLESRLDLRNDVVDGWIRAKAGRVTARAGSIELGATPELLLHARGLELASGRGTVRAWLSLARWASVDRGQGARCQSSSIERASVFAELGSDERGRRSKVELFARDVRARWDDFNASGAVRVSAQQEPGGALRVDALASDIRVKSGERETEGWAAHAPRVALRARLSSHAGQLSGPVRVAAPRVAGRMGRTPVHGDVSLEWTLSRLDSKRRQAIGKAILAIDDAGVDGGDVPVRGWWGSLELPALRVAVRDEVSFFGEFAARMRDGLPALAVLSNRGDVPDWLPRVMPLDALRAQGMIVRSCRLTDVLFARVSGGGLLASGRIQSVPDDVRSAFLVQLARVSPVRVGLVNYEDELEAAVFAGNDWLREQYSKLDQYAVLRALEGCRPPAKVERCG